MTDSVTRFVFVDLETTGLLEREDFVCEVGLKVTDEKLNVLGEWSSLVMNDGWRARMASDQFVWSMHTKSGLIKDLDQLSGNFTAHRDNTREVVAYRARMWLTDQMGLTPKELPITGSSIQFDRDFLRYHMPFLNDFFSYRNIDISTIKELCYRLNPELARAIKAKFSKDNAQHRVLADINGSIEELRTYIDEFLFVPGEEVLALSDDAFEGQDPLPGLGLGELKQCA